MTYEKFKAYFYSRNWVRHFIKEYEIQHLGTPLEEALKESFDGGCGYNVVCRLICWRLTEQGYDYWVNIHREFSEYVRNCN